MLLQLVWICGKILTTLSISKYQRYFTWNVFCFVLFCFSPFQIYIHWLKVLILKIRRKIENGSKSVKKKQEKMYLELENLLNALQKNEEWKCIQIFMEFSIWMHRNNWRIYIINNIIVELSTLSIIIHHFPSFLCFLYWKMKKQPLIELFLLKFWLKSFQIVKEIIHSIFFFIFYFSLFLSIFFHHEICGYFLCEYDKDCQTFMKITTKT